MLRLKTLLAEDDIRAGVAQLGETLVQVYGETPLVVVGVLTGSLVFLADLIRRLPLRLIVALVQASSYRGAATRPGELALDLAGLPALEGRDVLLVDDIFDTGRTLAQLVERIRAQRPRSLRSAVLLRKLGRQEVEMTPDHVVFDIPDQFVVGYGLDYDGHYRNLPFVAALEESDLSARKPR